MAIGDNLKPWLVELISKAVEDAVGVRPLWRGSRGSDQIATASHRFLQPSLPFQSESAVNSLGRTNQLMDKASPVIAKGGWGERRLSCSPTTSLENSNFFPAPLILLALLPLLSSPDILGKLTLSSLQIL